jgi:plastocyanin
VISETPYASRKDDEFNVHTRDLGYFETQTVTFLADKKGTFEYYCTIHPEMKGIIKVV